MELIIKKPLKINYYDGELLYAFQGKKIFRSSDYGESWSEILKIDKLSLFSNFKLFNRLRRSGIHNLIPFNNNILIIVIKKYILVYKDRQLINKIKIKKGNRPLRQGILKVNNSIIFGDYWSNPNRKPVDIYRLNPITGKVEILLRLNNKRHIHFIQKDILNESKLFIGTGDRDNESCIFRYDLNSRELKKIGGGSQDWRAVSILQKKNYIYWGSDCPYQQNYIFKYDRNTKKLERLISIDGPAYYSTMNSQGKMFIATTIEDRNKHKAVIYSSEDGEKWAKFKEWKKDIFSERLFGYGVIEFIKGQEELESLYINLNGLVQK